MLLTTQERAVQQWVVDAIADCPDLAPIPPERVVWANQDFPDRGYPYALLSYTGSDELNATPSTRVNDSDELETSALDDTTVSITIVTKADDEAPTRDQVASSYIRELRARTRSFVASVLVDARLAVREANVVPDLARLQGGSQWESRGVIDLLLGHAIVVVENPGVIEQAEITGTTEPPTPVRTFLVG